MYKVRNKKISLLLALVFALTLVLPVGTAFAGVAVTSEYATITAPRVEKDTSNAHLGRISIECEKLMSTVAGVYGHEAWIELPEDYNVNVVDVKQAVYGYDSTYNPDGDGDLPGVSISRLDGNNGFLLTIDTKQWTVDHYNNVLIELEFTDVDVPADAEAGAIKAYFDNIRGQLIDGEVIIGYVVGGELTLSVEDKAVMADEGDKVTIRFEEEVAGTWNKTDEFKLILPAGLEWGDEADATIEPVFGDLASGDIYLETDEDELIVRLMDSSDKSAARSAFDLTIDILVEDADDVDAGDIVAKIRGDYTTDPDDEIVLGYFGDYGVTVEADDPDTQIFCGQTEQQISDLTLTESLCGSLIDGRSISLELPDNAKWVKVNDEFVYNLKKGDPVCDVDEGVGLEFLSISDDYRTLTLKIAVDEDEDGDIIDRRAEDYDEAELTLEDLYVMTKAAVTDDLVISIDATCCGVTPEELKVAEIVNPIKAKATTVEPVEIGYLNQAAGSIVITETEAGAIRDEDVNGNEPAYLIVVLPKDVEFNGEPDVKVTDGDLRIGDVDYYNAGWGDFDVDDAVLMIEVERESTEASEITISNIKYDLNRTIPYGEIKVAISGSSIFDWDCYDVWYEDDDKIVDTWADYAQFEVANAAVETPAPVTKTVEFKVGDPGVTVINGRTLVQVNTLCETLGLVKSWDAVNKVAYFVKNGTVVAFPIGKNEILINSNPLPVDQGGVIVNGATYATLRGIQMAFGGELDWDNDTKTATFTFEARQN